MAFTRLDRGPRLSDAIADQLLDAILSGQFNEGDPLPSERELGEQFGVSRTVVREAIRTLMTRGVVEARSGRGVRVLRLGTEPVTEAMALLLRGSPEITFFKVHEVRTTLETDLAALAAQRASEEQVAELQEIVRLSEEAADLEVESQLDVDFHRREAREAMEVHLAHVEEAWRTRESAD
jgi:GntR family transcriptional regulator, transcriptional repressor for pyruvate dehydrogenase complex